jgi:hypothetical protein
VLQAALSYKKQTEKASSAAEREARTLWGQVDRSRILDSWRALVPLLFRSIVTAQAQAAGLATPYVDEAIRIQGGDNPTDGQILPLALAGWASDGRPLDTLLLSPAFTAIEALNRGATVTKAMSFGQAHTRMIAATQVADAYRVAPTIVSTTRQVTRYTRAITPPSCSRCIILAGSDRSWKTDFKRHPRCNCISVPVVGDPREDLITDPKAYFDSLSKADQDRIFTTAGAQAIRDGADMARVVNARRKAAGLSGAAEGQRRSLRRRNVFGADLFTTAELRVTGSRGQQLTRLMPESIYEIAKDHADALRLLKIHGYIY